MSSSIHHLKPGPNPLTRIFFFVLLSTLVMIADARFDAFPEVRRVVATVIFPLQKVASFPFTLQEKVEQSIADFKRIEEIDELRRKHLNSRYDFFRLRALASENERLRALLGATKHTDIQTILAEVLYMPRDPFSRKVTVDKGTLNGIKAGQVVMDELGVIGQITQVYPWTSEITLITDKNHLVPVQIQRNSLRTVISGTGRNGELELRFLSISTDIRQGDLLVTSGIGGVYPPGLPVGQVTHIEYDRSHKFARIICTPVAGVDRHKQVLVLTGSSPLVPEVPDNSETHASQTKQKIQDQEAL